MSLKVVAAYLLAVLGGNKNPDEAAISKILSSVGIEADKEHLSKLVSQLKGKDVHEVISQGQSKLASLPSGGVAVASSSAAPAQEKGGKKEEKKEEKKPPKEEPKEEADEDMGMSLFD